jgi:hypothetical protein
MTMNLFLSLSSTTAKLSRRSLLVALKAPLAIENLNRPASCVPARAVLRYLPVTPDGTRVESGAQEQIERSPADMKVDAQQVRGLEAIYREMFGRQVSRGDRQPAQTPPFHALTQAGGASDSGPQLEGASRALQRGLRGLMSTVGIAQAACGRASSRPC